MKVDPSLDLDSVLNGELPVNDTPTKLERPGYKREGLYGPTPFIPKGDPIIIALMIEQSCAECQSTHLYFGGLFREFSGQALQGEATFQNRLKEAPREAIKHTRTLHEEVPYCPHCLGTGDLVSGAANQGEGEALSQTLPIYNAEEWN